MENIKNQFRFTLPNLNVKYNELEKHNAHRIPDHPKRRSAFWWKILSQTLLNIIYVVLSTGLICYNSHTLSWGYQYPITMYASHTVVKFLICALVLRLLDFSSESKRVRLPLKDTITSVAPPAFASGFELGFYYSAIQLATLPLYQMTASSTIVFTLILTFVLKLAKKSWLLVGIVALIFAGQIAFSYTPTDVHVLGFILVLLESFAKSVHWTLPQYVMQQSRPGLSKPIDIMYHMQPWMLLSIIPVCFSFEGAAIYNMWSYDHFGLISTIMITVSGGMLSFCLELTEMTIISRTSSLTLCTTEILKGMLLSVQFYHASGSGSSISDVNFLGLQTCFAGVVLYTILQLWTTEEEETVEIGSISKSVMEKEPIPDKTQI